jgi:hypothetical protein
VNALERTLLLVALMIVAACASDIDDLRLESVRPIEAVELPPTLALGVDPRRFGGIVAEFSTEQDLRAHAARSSASFRAYVERCAGRTHIEDTMFPRLWISRGDFSDDLGVLAEAGRPIGTDPLRVGPVAGVPREGRFFVLLPIHLMAFAWERQNDNSGWTIRRVAERDVLQAPDDLCVFARGASYLEPVWRSNTVVIPFAAIRAALDAARAQPEAPRQGAPSN